MYFVTHPALTLAYMGAERLQEHSLRAAASRPTGLQTIQRKCSSVSLRLYGYHCGTYREADRVQFRRSYETVGSTAPTIVSFLFCK